MSPISTCFDTLTSNSKVDAELCLNRDAITATDILRARANIFFTLVQLFQRGSLILCGARGDTAVAVATDLFRRMTSHTAGAQGERSNSSDAVRETNEIAKLPSQKF